jgi:class 3 adenylate cyclase/tetratricopeptide (TPR) repeat protein
MRCAKCGATSQTGKRFCGDCGAPLSIVVRSELGAGSFGNISSVAVTEGIQSERRHLTVLFADLVGSTRLASERDPEDWRDMVTQCLGAIGDEVTGLRGYVARYMGDGVLAYFGWPTASEDDAARAVRAGFMIVQAIATINRRFSDIPGLELAVRVGIHSGWVVIDEMGSNKVEIFGDTPNIAARVQARCAPNSVLMTSAVHDLVAGQFIVEDCGAHQLAGIERPVQLYRAVAPSGARRTWSRVGGRAPTRFVNRKRELDVLWSSWLRVRNGEGQCVIVTGEPGIGKSRLLEQFRSKLNDVHLWIEAAGERFSESTPFHTVIKLLEQALGWPGEASADERIDQLQRALRFSELDPSEMLPLIADLLKLPSAAHASAQLAPEEARRRLMGGLTSWILKLAERQPLILAVEDLHWVDPSTIELLGMLKEQQTRVPILRILTSRPEYHPPWTFQGTEKSIVVGRLSNDEISEMVAGSSATDDVTEEVVASVVRRSDGIPIFAEELLAFILDRGNAAGEIPTTLLDSLTARVDRLGPARRVAQIAAVLGREFDYDLLRSVTPGSDHYLQSSLAMLIQADLIYSQGSPPKASYQFRHALIRDAAYQGLLKSERRELHARVARTMNEQFAAQAAARPELLARHWAEAGELEAAIAAWMRAGQAALARCAFKEAEDSYRQASASLQRLPASETRDRRELEVCSGLVRVLQVTKGYSAGETVQLGARARELAEQLGDVAQLFRQGARTWASIFFTGDYAAAASLAHQIGSGTTELTNSDPTELSKDSHRFFSHYAQVQAHFYAGNLARVEDHFTILSPLLDTKSIEAASYLIIPIGVASHTAWQQGRVDLARARMYRAMDLAKKSKDPYAMAMALHFKGNLDWCLDAPRRVEMVANRLMSLSEQHGLDYTLNLARMLLGAAKSELGQAAVGIELINQALAGFAKTGAKVGMTYFLTLLARAHAQARDTEAALRTLQKALTANPQELIWRGYTLTCRGELLLQLRQLATAEADFRNAIEASRSLGHMAWQLRAATRLARLLMQRGDHLTARAILRPIYSQFAEDRRVPDLRQARSLLSEMADHLPAA